MTLKVSISSVEMCRFSKNHFICYSGLKEENKKLNFQIKDEQILRESEKQLQLQLKQTNDKLLTENAELSSSLTEMKQKLESEIRVRENRDAKLLLDTQEVVVSREREKESRTQISRLQNELERDRTKAKTLQDKVNKLYKIQVEFIGIVHVKVWFILVLINPFTISIFIL